MIVEVITAKFIYESGFSEKCEIYIEFIFSNEKSI